MKQTAIIALTLIGAMHATSLEVQVKLEKAME